MPKFRLIGKDITVIADRVEKIEEEEIREGMVVYGDRDPSPPPVYLIQGGKKRHIKTKEILDKMLADPSVGSEVIRVAQAKLDAIERGKDITEWPEEEPSPPPPPPPKYKMSVMGFWIGSDYALCHDLGCTHLWSFKSSYIDPDAALAHGLKTWFHVWDVNDIKELKANPACGGYLAGSWHEPDLLGKDIQANIDLYNAIRDIDPDKLARPCVILYDMTDTEAPQFPGWKGTFTPLDHDILVIDCYPYHQPYDPEKELKKGWRLVSTYEDLNKNQVIPHLQAFYGTAQHGGTFQKPDVWRQYEFWKAKLGTKSMGFYTWVDEYTGVSEDPWLQEQVRKVNQDIFK